MYLALNKVFLHVSLAGSFQEGFSLKEMLSSARKYFFHVHI